MSEAAIWARARAPFIFVVFMGSLLLFLIQPTFGPTSFRQLGCQPLT